MDKRETIERAAQFVKKHEKELTRLWMEDVLEEVVNEMKENPEKFKTNDKESE